MGWLIQVVSGHGYNNYHQSRLGIVADATCRFCNEEEEETWHIIRECPALAHARMEVFDDNNYQFPNDVTNLLGFISKANISCVLSPGTHNKRPAERLSPA